MHQYVTQPIVPKTEMEQLQSHQASTTLLRDTIQALPIELKCILGSYTLPDDNGASIV